MKRHHHATTGIIQMFSSKEGIDSSSTDLEKETTNQETNNTIVPSCVTCTKQEIDESISQKGEAHRTEQRNDRNKSKKFAIVINRKGSDIGGVKQARDEHEDLKMTSI